jgi:hypothetical protein
MDNGWRRRNVGHPFVSPRFDASSPHSLVLFFFWSEEEKYRREEGSQDRERGKERAAGGQKSPLLEVGKYVGMRKARK